MYTSGRTRLTLVITEAFVALSAFVAGAMFMAEPSGRLMAKFGGPLKGSPIRLKTAPRPPAPSWYHLCDVRATWPSQTPLRNGSYR
jgi:hypothetical protein